VLPNQRGDLPTSLTTLGDHIRKKRLNLGLSQREAARIIGVEQCSVYNWEKRGMNPAQRIQTAIFNFLGYDPSQNGGTGHFALKPGIHVKNWPPQTAKPG
jgi:transcriptional regulator with XRE-family HTH domain